MANSLVQLVFSAVGTEAVSDALGDVNSKLGDMTRELGRMATAALSVDKAFEGVRDAMDDGAMFERLSDRTGQTVRDLVVLDQAFRNAGLGTEFIAQSASRLERALGGVNEMGGSTDTAFRRLGTSIAQLRPLNYAEQLQVLAAGFGKLATQSDKAAVATQIFGRGGTQMLQLLNDPKMLDMAAEQVGRLGDRMQSDAEVFRDVDVQLSVIGKRFKEMWVTVAEQLTPALATVAKIMSSLNLSGFGSFLGAAGPGIAGAIGAAFAADKIDASLYRMLDRMEEGTSRSLLRGASNAMADVVAWTPVALAATVAAQIILGVAEARASSQWHELLNDIQDVHRVEAAAHSKIAGITSAADGSAVAGSLQAQIADLQAQRDSITKQMATAPLGVQQISTPYAQQSMFGNLMGGLGAANYKGTDGKDRDYQKDQTKVGGLDSEIANLQLQLKQGLGSPEAIAQTIADAQLKAIKDGLVPLVAQLPELAKKNQKLQFDNLAPADQQKNLSSQLSTLQTQRSAIPAGLAPDESQAMKLNLDNQILEVQKQLAEVAKKLTEEAKKTASEEEKQAIYALQTQMEVAKAAGNDALAQKLKEQIDLRRANAELSGKDLDLAKQRVAAEDKIWQAQKNQEDQRKAAEAARQALEDQRTAVENELTAIRENLANLDADYSRNDADKWADRKAAIENEIKVLNAAIQADLLAAKAAAGKGDKAAAEQFAGAAASKGQQVGQLHRENAQLGPDPNSYGQQIQKALNDAMKSIGTTAQALGHTIASTVGAAFDAVRQNIVKAITVTGDWKRAISQIGVSIEQSLVGAIVNMAVEWAEKMVIMKLSWIATRLGMAASDKAIGGASTAALIPIALATSAIWAAPAALATIATFGGAAAAAPVEIAASMAATQGLALASEGGFFPGDPTKPRGIFHGDEFVLSAPAVRNLGGGAAVGALHEAAKQGRNSAAQLSSSNPTSSRTPNLHTYIDKDVFMRAIASDVEGIAHKVSMRNIRRNA